MVSTIHQAADLAGPSLACFPNLRILLMRSAACLLTVVCCVCARAPGVCNLCNSAVRFIIKRDPAKKLLFCSVQSPKAEPYLRG
jgi:hypothetical protein